MALAIGGALGTFIAILPTGGCDNDCPGFLPDHKPPDGTYVLDQNQLAVCTSSAPCPTDEKVEVSGNGTVLVETFTDNGVSWRIEYTGQ